MRCSLELGFQSIMASIPIAAFAFRSLSIRSALLICLDIVIQAFLSVTFSSELRAAFRKPSKLGGYLHRL